MDELADLLAVAHDEADRAVAALELGEVEDPGRTAGLLVMDEVSRVFAEKDRRGIEVLLVT